MDCQKARVRARQNAFASWPLLSFLLPRADHPAKREELEGNSKTKNKIKKTKIKNSKKSRGKS